MFKSNLNDSVDNKVLQTQKLLENPNDKSLVDFARKISPKNKLVEYETQVGINITKDKYTKEFSKTFHINDIYAECRKYALCFNKSKFYEGEYSRDFLSKLKAFTEKEGLMVSEHDLSDRLYILALGAQDTDTKEFKDNLVDPLVLFQISKDYFILIDGNKSYINLYNWWRGFKNLSIGNCRIAYIIENYILAFLLVLSISFYLGSNISNWWYIFLIILSIIIMTFRCAVRHSAVSDIMFKQRETYFNNIKYPK